MMVPFESLHGLGDASGDANYFGVNADGSCTGPYCPTPGNLPGTFGCPQDACHLQGMVFSPTYFMCLPPGVTTSAETTPQGGCMGNGGVWNASTKTCTLHPCNQMYTPGTGYGPLAQWNPARAYWNSAPTPTPPLPTPKPPTPAPVPVPQPAPVPVQQVTATPKPPTPTASTAPTVQNIAPQTLPNIAAPVAPTASSPAPVYATAAAMSAPANGDLSQYLPWAIGAVVLILLVKVFNK